jgi:hypothetical protein
VRGRSAAATPRCGCWSHRGDVAAPRPVGLLPLQRGRAVVVITSLSADAAGLIREGATYRRVTRPPGDLGGARVTDQERAGMSSSAMWRAHSPRRVGLVGSDHTGTPRSLEISKVTDP